MTPNQGQQEPSGGDFKPTTEELRNYWSEAGAAGEDALFMDGFDRWPADEVRKAQADMLNDLADHLSQPGVVWHGDGGVTVRELGWEKRWPQEASKTLSEWLNDRAEQLRDEAA